MTRKIDVLHRKLGYEFEDKKLLDKALTHRSVSKNNNERLEFLGDALLSLIIAEALYKKFPETAEGDLSRVRSKLVKGETLSIIAREFKLGEHLNLGVGELKTGGFNRDSILADSFEAIIGAMFLDSNHEICKERVLAWYDKRLNDSKLFHKLKDPKTVLQEYLQARQMPLPEYDIVEVSGEPHEQVFTIVCKVDGVTHQTKDSGTTRRQAEQKVAKEFLAWMEQDNDR